MINEWHDLTPERKPRYSTSYLMTEINEEINIYLSLIFIVGLKVGKEYL